MSEETAVTETTEAEDQDQVESSAGDDGEDPNEDTTGKGWNSATRARFAEVQDREKAAKAELATAQSRIGALEAKLEAALENKATETAAPLKPPPGMSQEDQITWIIENTNDRWFHKQFGMTPSEAKAALQSLPEASKNAQRARWDALCEKAGLNPNDTKVQRYARGLANEDGMTLEKIVSECAEAFGKKPPKTNKKPPNRMEVGSETAEMIAEEDLPFDKREATKAAREGRKAPVLDADEILRRAARKRNAARA